MPMIKGSSPQAVSANVKELMKSGRKQKQAVAIALAHKRKYAKGGMVDQDADGGFIDASDAEEMGDNDLHMHDSLSPDDGGYGSANNEQKQRSVDQIAKQGRFQEESIANPHQQTMDRALALALDNYAMGGLIEGGEDGIDGSEPNEDMELQGAEGAEPEPSGLPEMFLKEIADRKKKRRYM